MGIQLNDNEKDAVKQINEKYRSEFEQLREANKGTAPGRNAQLDAQVKAIADRQEAEIRAALTAEHQAQFPGGWKTLKPYLRVVPQPK